MNATEFKEGRTRLGLTQTGLAPLLGLTRKNYVSDIERGVVPVSSQVNLLMNALLAALPPEPLGLSNGGQLGDNAPKNKMNRGLEP